MGKAFKILTAGLLAAAVHSPANAALVSFTGDGNFSNVTNCNGGSPGCSITNSGNVLKMSGASSQNKPGKLAITAIVGTNVPTDANDYVLRQRTEAKLDTDNTDR